MLAVGKIFESLSRNRPFVSSTFELTSPRSQQHLPPLYSSTMSSDAALLAEIAKLDRESNLQTFTLESLLTPPGSSLLLVEAISQARRPQAPPPPSYRPPYKAHPYSTSSSSIPAGSRNKKLIINPSSSKPSAAAGPSAAPGPSRTSKPLSFPVPTAPSTSATAPGSSTQWVQKTGRHMSLMNAETFEKA